MHYPPPTLQDLQQLLNTLDGKYVQLDALRERVNGILSEVQFKEGNGSLKQYASLCTNLSAQLGQYMRLRRFVLLPYLQDLQHKEEEGHDCKSCGSRCRVQHASYIASMREAHAGFRELADHLQPAAVDTCNIAVQPFPEFRSLLAGMMEMERVLNELLFIEESVLVPMIVNLQRNIGAYE
jgi:hypothetical protein